MVILYSTVLNLVDLNLLLHIHTFPLFDEVTIEIKRRKVNADIMKHTADYKVADTLTVILS